MSKPLHYNSASLNAAKALPASYFLELNTLNIQAVKDAQGWQQAYSEILRLARHIQSKPELQQDLFEIKACESKLWLAIRLKREEKSPPTLEFCLDGQSRVIKGLAALLLIHLQALSLEEIKAVNTETIMQQYGFDKHLSPSRNNGLSLLIQQVKNLLA